MEKFKKDFRDAGDICNACLQTELHTKPDLGTMCVCDNVSSYVKFSWRTDEVYGNEHELELETAK